ncbi:Cytochrome P450-pinF1, plant-inducible [Bradyrhizobium ivorense]|uniref:Cytochrome P450-pinF1, plant-inducible n=1 Tax=Bradyrhizobium ivorense TaxID=2511166 RepID=A0A508SU19_9BRAD|nr:cytochrome P450 [Bradyrhizobium ivorense]VIO65983.1 Cytochrome P450-pinF1, plant-inducible [Bradyrhizobium ivorense]
MAEVIGTSDRVALGAFDGLPVLNVADLDADPHGMFRRYRAAYPFVGHQAGGYLILRHADIERLGNGSGTAASETAHPEMFGVTEGALFDLFEQGMLTANGAVHRRRRSPFSRSFAARTMADLRPQIRRSAEELIESWYADGRVEFVDQFAAQLPARVIGNLLGLPRADIPSFTNLVYSVTRFFSSSIVPDEIPELEAACRGLRDYVEKTLDDRRSAPRDDFLSDFLGKADAAGELSPLEIVFQIVQLIIGGTDTTRVAIVMQLALLLQHREQWDAVCRDPSLVPGAVAEAMRFEPSVASFVRVTTEDIELGGAVLPARQFIILSTMSAARDGDAYDRPDVFDIRRTDQPRLLPAFGAGAHRCIGEALARVELEESLAALAARLPHLRLDEAPVIKGHSGIRRVDSMRISWQP